MEPDGAAPPITGNRRGLDRTKIVDAALSYIDEHGVQSLSMRGLGAALGVEAMSLYRYVSGREDLLEAIVARLLDGLRQELEARRGQTWQAYLQALAHAVRSIATEHSAAFPLIATRHPAAPWLRPPLRSLEVVEDFLKSLTGFGFSDSQAVGAYRSFSSFLLGQLLLEAATRGAETAPVEEPMDEGDASIPNADGRLDLSSNPTVERLRSTLSEDRSQEEFEVTLETLLDRLEMSLSQ